MRKLCWFALPFCGACLLSFWGVPLPVLAGVGAAALAAGVFAVIGKRRALLLACVGAALGLLWFQGYRAIFHAPAERLGGRTQAFSATVLDWPQATSYGSSVLARLELEGESDVRVLLYAGEEGLALAPGDRVSGVARHVLADTVRGDSVSYYISKGIYLRLYLKGELAVTSVERPPVSLWPVYFSRLLKQSAARLFPEDAAGFMTALLTGDKSGMSTGTYTSLQRAGIAHVAAVSGLHLNFLAGLLGVFLAGMRRRPRALVTIGALFFFAAAVGNSPSVLRAAMMQTIALLAPLLGREEDKPTTLSAVLFVLIASNPYAAGRVALQLSFGAMAGIYLTTGPLYRRMTGFLSRGGSWPRRLGRRLWQLGAATFSTTLGAMLFTVPLTALRFGTVSLISPLTNLLTMWAVEGTFALGLIAALLGTFLPALAALAAWPAVLLARFVLAAARFLGRPAFSTVSMNGPYLPLWLAAVYLILLIVLLRRCRRAILPVCAGVVTLCAALLLTRFSLLSGPLTVTMLDVGQGQCVLLCSGSRTALIDCGGNDGNAGDIAADYLQTLGISRLDLLVLTHCHDDHANGVPELLERLEVSSLVLPASEGEAPFREEILSLAGEKGTEITELERNTALSFGESTLTLYAPLGDGGDNEEGLFALATCGDFDLLVTGDANSFVESLLVKYDDLPDIEVLAAGHHGSAGSTSAEFLDAVTPETCLISAGYNTYGHPAPETLARLAEREIAIYRTDLMGNLTVRCRGGD